MESINFIRLKKEIKNISKEKCKKEFIPHSFHHARGKNQNYQKASVLILLYRKEDKWHTVYIRRNIYKGYHSGEISFPGGKQDKNESALATAIRESREETGISGHYITLLGTLPSVTIEKSNFLITPFVAYTEQVNFRFMPDPVEVQEIIEVSLSDLFDKANHHKKTIKINNKIQYLQSFVVSKNQIWGATGYITCMLLEAVSLSS